MGALAFLSQGNAPSTSSNYTQTSTQLPSWYTDYTSQILNKAAQFAAQPYQTYSGPRIAAYDPSSQAAASTDSQLVSGITQGSQQAQGDVQQGVDQNNPLGAAQPYLSAGTDATYNTVGNYLNPYNANVTGAIANAANTNFQNSTMPSLESSIIGSGNITGSSTEGTNLMENAEQQNEQNITNAQAGALESGYQGSLTAAQQGNQNNLTAATTAGNLNSQGVTNDINAGATTSNISNNGANTALGATAAENTLGQQQQGYNQSNLNLAYQDFLNQQNYPMTQASAMQGALSGITVPQATTNYTYANGLNGGNSSLASPQTSPLNQLIGAGIGATTPQP